MYTDGFVFFDDENPWDHPVVRGGCFFFPFGVLVAW